MLDTLDQPHLDSTCLTFLVLHGVFPELGYEWRPVVQTYSLETGLAGWPEATDTESISLRTPRRLPGWEPMTPKKFELMALDRGVIGPSAAGNDHGQPKRIIEPKMAAVVVSPEGFVCYWDGSHSVLVSDVERLGHSPQPLTDRSGDWSRYRLYGDQIQGPGHGGVARDEAGLGNGVTPILIHSEQLYFDSIAQFGMTMLSPIEESHNDCYGEYTPAAARFVKDQFGIDASRIDWPAANEARQINDSFSHSAPFDPIPACAALRQAVAQQAAPAAINKAFTRTAITQRSPRGPAR